MKFSYNNTYVNAIDARVKTSYMSIDEDNVQIAVDTNNLEDHGELVLDDQGEPVVFFELYIDSDGPSEVFCDLVYNGAYPLYLEHPFMIAKGSFVLGGLARVKKDDGTRITTYLFKSSNSNATITTGEE